MAPGFCCESTYSARSSRRPIGCHCTRATALQRAALHHETVPSLNHRAVAGGCDSAFRLVGFAGTRVPAGPNTSTLSDPPLRRPIRGVATTYGMRCTRATFEGVSVGIKRKDNTLCGQPSPARPLSGGRGTTTLTLARVHARGVIERAAAGLAVIPDDVCESGADRESKQCSGADDEGQSWDSTVHRSYWPISGSLGRAL